MFMVPGHHCTFVVPDLHCIFMVPGHQCMFMVCLAIIVCSWCLQCLSYHSLCKFPEVIAISCNPLHCSTTGAHSARLNYSSWVSTLSYHLTSAKSSQASLGIISELQLTSAPSYKQSLTKGT